VVLADQLTDHRVFIVSVAEQSFLGHFIELGNGFVRLDEVRNEIEKDKCPWIERIVSGV